MKLVLLLPIILFQFILKAQMSVDHYFIYAKERKVDGFNYDYGKYSLTEYGLDIQTQYPDADSIYKRISAKGHKGVIFYIHGFSADNRMHEANQGKLLHKEFYSQLANQYDLVISLKWSPEKDYPSTYPSAMAKGKYFYHYVDTLLQILRKDNKELPVTFIMHSMGNRVFDNIIQAKDEVGRKWKLHQVLMCAPDLEHDAFFTTLKNLPSDCKEIHYLCNIDDRTLGVAKAMKPYERLGIVGHKDSDKLPANIYKLDTTGTKDNEGWFAQMSLHRYWYASPTIRDEVRKILRR